MACKKSLFGHYGSLGQHCIYPRSLRSADALLPSPDGCPQKGCHYKVPQTEWLTKNRNLFFHNLEARNLKQLSTRLCSLQNLLGRILPGLFQLLVAPRIPWPVDTLLQLLLPSLPDIFPVSLCLHIVFPLFIRIHSHIGLKSYPNSV